MRSWKLFALGMMTVLALGAAALAEEGTKASAETTTALGPVGTGALLKKGLSVLSDDLKKWMAIAAGFGVAIASFGGALGQSRAISAAVDGIARNPGAAGKIFAPTLIVGLALIESLVLLSFVVAFGLAGKI